MKVWTPKNKEISLPRFLYNPAQCSPIKLCYRLTKEYTLPFKDWLYHSFPSYEVPEEVVTHVNTQYWGEEITRVSESQGGAAASKIMQQVMDQLVNGADSLVGHPGNKITSTPNFFSFPAIDLPRIVDSLATEIKAGHMAGPLHPASHPDVKINGLMAVPKQSGDRRQVRSHYIVPT